MELNQENLIIMDEKGLLAKIVRDAFTEQGLRFVRFSSGVKFRDLLPRFYNAERIVIHWEAEKRSGGALIEELREVDQGFPIAEKVVVLISKPTHQDIYYCRELGIEKIVRTSPHRVAGVKVKEDICRCLGDKSLVFGQDKGFWSRVHSIVDKNPFGLSERECLKLEEMAQTYLSKKNLKKTATTCDLYGYIAANRNEELADQHWFEALELNPNYMRPYHSLLLFYEHHKQYEKAVGILQKLHYRNRHSLERLVKLGELHRLMKKDAKSEHYFKMALERDGECARAANGLSEIMVDQQRYDELTLLLTRPLDLDRFASYLNRKAVEMVKEEKYGRALEIYLYAQKSLPDQKKGPMLFYNIGLCYYRWQKFDLAKSFLKIALLKNPTYDKARRMLTRLDSLP